MWTPLSVNVTAGSLTNAMANRESDNIPVNKETQTSLTESGVDV